MQLLKNYYHLLQSFLANVRYGFPARKLTIIGVTGTDGKTTTTSMIYHVLKENRLRVAMISTIFAKIDDEVIDIGLHVTTPEPWDLPKILRKMVDRGIEYAVIESTSSGLHQNRLFSVNYDAATITNIGHDHIDYHKTWENYANAKFKIVQKVKPNGLVVLNKDHNESAKWLKEKLSNFEMSKKIEWYCQEGIVEKKHSVNGIEFKYKNVKFSLPIIGEYNFSNALGVIKICERYLGLESIAKALETFQAPLGRMQMMQNYPFTIVVDFAHTPSGLEPALNSINKIRPNKNSKVITVFGCAGQRDPKRREMGEVSVRLSDITVITLEDPRTENLYEINSQIIEHANKSGGKLIKRFASHEEFLQFNKNIPTIEKKSIFAFDYESVDNRKDAVTFAIAIAKKDDIVFITGKGHEESLAIGNPIIEYPYTDQETIKELIIES